jgi:hypothetical protein
MALTQVPASMMATGGVPSFDGIKFPASQSASGDANTLDDYEEGSWTPTDTSGASLTFSTANGTYTKIGRVVTIRAKIIYPSTASGVSAAIGGLPFVVGSYGTGNYPTNAIFSNGNLYGSLVLAYDGQSYFQIYNIAAQTNSTNAQLSTANMNISLTYMTTT